MIMNKNVLSLLHSQKFIEFIRFCIVGVVATGIHYGIYLLLNQWININYSYTIGYAISFVCNYYLSNVFTFNTKPTMKRGFGFTLSHAINYGLQLLLLNLFVWIGVKDSLAPIPTWCITIPVNFMLVRYFLKNEKES